MSYTLQASVSMPSSWSACPALPTPAHGSATRKGRPKSRAGLTNRRRNLFHCTCLLYTSDAADDM
eukprot:7427250-Alexandrium_andersonii.AAC.1